MNTFRKKEETVCYCQNQELLTPGGICPNCLGHVFPSGQRPEFQELSASQFDEAYFEMLEMLEESQRVAA